MANSSRDRWFDHLAYTAIHHPRTVLTLTLACILLGATLAPGLTVSTSRQGLAGAEDPYQERMNAFFERFDDPNSPLFFIVSGGERGHRRAAVDQLAGRLAGVPELQSRIVHRLGPGQVAEAMLLQSTEAPNELRSLAPSDMDLTTFVEGGVPLYLSALRERLSNLAAGLQMRMLFPLGASLDPGSVGAVLERVGTLARTTDAYLAGENALSHFDMKVKNFTMLDSAGYIAGHNEAYLMVSLFPVFKSDEVADQKPLIDKIRGIRDTLVSEGTLHPEVKIQLTGLPTLAVDELEVIEAGLFQSSFATGMGLMILFLIVFRSIRQSLFAAMPLVVGILLTLAFVRLTFGQLNLITSSFISVLLGLGIDFPVHLLSRFNEFRRDGNQVTNSIYLSLRGTGPGILTGAVTTILAFLTTTTTEFTAFAELGIITSVGLAFMVLATFFVLPNLIFRLESKRDLVQPELQVLSNLTPLVRRAFPLLLLGGLLAAAAGALNLNRIEFNYRYFDFLPHHTESASALRLLERDISMGPTFATVTASSIEEARELTKAFRALPSVASVQSATDLLPPLEEGLLTSLRRFMSGFPRQPNFERINASAPSPQFLTTTLARIILEVEKIQTLQKLTGYPTESTTDTLKSLRALRNRVHTMGSEATPLLNAATASLSDVFKRAWTTAHSISERGRYLPSDVPPILQHRFVSRKKNELALFVYPSGNIWDSTFAQKFTEDLEQLSPTVSGFVISLYAHSSMILSGFKRAALLAAFLVMLLLLYDFRSPLTASLAMLPTAIGWLWMLGIMTALNLPFNVANIVALPLVLGIGIDAGVHMMHRFLESQKENDGVAKLEDLLEGTGSAVLFASVTTIVGFAGLMVADYGGMKSLGLIMVIGISSCLTACLLVLPSVLILLKRAK